MESVYNLGQVPLPSLCLAPFATAVTEHMTRGIYLGSETKDAVRCAEECEAAGPAVSGSRER